MIWNQVFLIILNYTVFQIETKTILGQFFFSYHGW